MNVAYCSSVREDGLERCLQPLGHDGPHRGRLGTWVWRDDHERCPHQVDGARCMLKPGHIKDCARLPG